MLDPEKSAHAQDSLYKRLGGYDAIAAFVAELMPRLYADPTLWVYWKGKSQDSRRKGEQLLVDFLGSAFEGPVFYAGPDMKSSHRGLGITQQEWDIALRHIDVVCGKLGVADGERAEVMEAANSLKWDIVEEPPVAAE